MLLDRARRQPDVLLTCKPDYEALPTWNVHKRCPVHGLRAQRPLSMSLASVTAE